MHRRRKARRCGRPAKPGPRTASGQRSRAATAAVDPGTLEGVRNRALLVNGSPVELAGSAVGILLANGHIDADQARAAGRYAALRAVLFGKARPTVAHDLVEPHDAPWRPEDRLVQVREAFESLCHRLERDQKQQLDLLVIDGKVPGWFRAAKLGRRLSAVDLADQAALLSGLEALARR